MSGKSVDCAVGRQNSADDLSARDHRLKLQRGINICYSFLIHSRPDLKLSYKPQPCLDFFRTLPVKRYFETETHTHTTSTEASYPASLFLFVTGPGVPRCMLRNAGDGALRGVRVLDLSRILAGPYATMLLGDLGAEVIKVERPGRGDDTRSWGPPFAAPGQSAYYLCANRNKYSIAVDIKSSKGRSLISSLAAKSDVLVENFVPGKLDEMGLGYEDLSRINPKLVYCSISGFGASGPYKDRPGYDVIASAMGGLMGITGPEDGPPAKAGVAITDVCTGLYAHGAILAALLARSQTGTGQRIDCSLLETQVASLVNIASNFLVAGKVGRPLGTAHESIVPYQAFATADGQVVVGALNNEQYFALCEAINGGDIASDQRFKTNPGRVEHRKELLEKIQAIFSQKPTAHWLSLFEGAAFPYGPINDMAQVFSDEQVLHREMVKEIDHPTIGKLRVVGPAVKYSKTPATIRLAPPLLGQHTEEVLRTVLGLKPDEIQKLRDDGIINPS